MARVNAAEEPEKDPLDLQVPNLTEANLAGACQTAQLPLEREKVSVQAVKMSWYEQLIEEEMLDEEHGTLRGTPLAVINVHGQDCTIVPHVHVLWKRAEGALRLSLFYLDMQHDPRYRAAEKKNQRLRQECANLLALCLAPTASYDTTKDDRKHIHINAYNLSLSLETYKVLERVQKAREAYQRDVTLWQQWVRSKQQTEREEKPPQQTEAVELAREVLKELGLLGVQAIHPDLIDQRPTRAYAYFSGRSNVLSTRDVHVRKTRTSARFRPRSAEKETVFLYWERVGKDDPFTDEEEPLNLVTAATMRRLGQTHGYALRLVLAETAMQEALKQAENLARSYTPLWLLLDMDGGEEPQQALPDPAAIWELRGREIQIFDDYGQRWKESILLVEGLEQLFIT